MFSKSKIITDEQTIVNTLVNKNTILRKVKGFFLNFG